MDVEGPYLETPSEEQHKNPLPANLSLIQMTAGATWGDSFCSSHQTGTFCQDTTQVRCCKKTWGYVKCGSTWHSASCGWNGGGGGMFDSRRRFGSTYSSSYSSYNSFDSRRRFGYGGYS